MGIFALEQYTLRKAEQAELFEAIEAGIQENKALGSAMVDKWLEEKTTAMTDIYEVSMCARGLF